MPFVSHRPQVNPAQLALVASGISLLLVMVVAFQAAHLTWQLLPVPSLPVPPAVSPSAVADTTQANPQLLSGWHLFGEISIENPPPVTVVEAPETRLDLRLVGILHSDNKSNARAIIGQRGEAEQVYSLGDPIAPGVSLHGVERNRVILSRAGRLESLSLPTERTSSPTNPTSPLPGTLNAEDESAVDATPLATELRDQLEEDPNAALSQIALASPYVQDGRFMGFRLRPGRDRRMLGRLGLRSGDVVTEINGNRLSSPADGLALMQALINADQIAVRVLRNGEEIPFTFYLNQ